jgi:hypothetical protein
MMGAENADRVDLAHWGEIEPLVVRMAEEN